MTNEPLKAGWELGPMELVFGTKHMAILKKHNPALNPAPFSRWTLRDKAAQRRLALR
jgi:hypothetical protein